MTLRRIRFTAIAERHFESERAWWLKNRDKKELFEIALEDTLERIAAHPHSGSIARRQTVKDLRRVQIRKIACHLYYTADEHTVTVRALWGARRGRGPLI